MRAAFTIILSVATSVLAAQNCKCQASDGTGPQWNDLTQQCCGAGACGSIPGASILGITTGANYPGPNHQCSAAGTNCIDAGAFVSCCQAAGAPSAFCWG